jgi:protein TonB
MRRGVAILLLVLSAAITGSADDKPKPIEKAGLWKVLQAGSLPADDLVQLIQERGVDFRLTTQDEQQLSSMRVDSRVVEAIRSNYRGPEQPPEMPDGPPLTENQTLLLLEAQIPSRTIATLVERRKVAYAMTPELGARLVAAGAGRGLIGAITLNPDSARKKPEEATATPTPASTPGPPPVLRVPQDEQAKRILYGPKPVYPSVARQMRVEGTVTLEVRIDVNGAVKWTHVESGPALLRKAAEEAVRTWRYEPATSGGVPAEVVTEVRVGFRIGI